MTSPNPLEEAEKVAREVDNPIKARDSAIALYATIQKLNREETLALFAQIFMLHQQTILSFSLSQMEPIMEEIRNVNIQCLSPNYEPEQIVSPDMAIDAGDRNLAGTVFSPEKYEECGECSICRLKQLLAHYEHLKKSLMEER